MNRHLFIESPIQVIELNPKSKSNLYDLQISSSSFILHKTTNIKDDYIIGPMLGTGAFGSVYTAVHKLSGQERAIKTLSKVSVNLDKTRKSKFFAEVDILRSIDHPNILRLFEFYEDFKYFHLVTEVVKGGELFDFIAVSKNLSEASAAFFFRQILNAVYYCHSKGIVHRDLKPENLLLVSKDKDSLVKIIDFGTSAFIDSGKMISGKIGTAYYMAPEVLRGEYNEKCDIWSCGVILFILLSGKPPFNGNSDKEIISNIEKGKLKFKSQIWSSISSEAKSLISKMLEPDQSQRLSASEVLSDVWFSMPCYTSLLSLNTLNKSLINITKFHTQSKLQQAVLSFIATQLSSRSETENLTKVFQMLDLNGDGRLSKQELLFEYNKFHPLVEAEEKVSQIMKEVDINCSGFIDYSEFLMAALKQETLLSKANLEIAFKSFDTGRKGSINMEDLKKMLGKEAQDAVWKNLISQVDLNKDGMIDLQEFTQMMLNIF